MCKGPVVGRRLARSERNVQGECGGVRVNQGRGVKCNWMGARARSGIVGQDEELGSYLKYKGSPLVV